MLSLIHIQMCIRDSNRTPDGEGFFGYNPVKGAYIEIISYEKLVKDAKKRNQVLFDKLFRPKSDEIISLKNDQTESRVSYG